MSSNMYSRTSLQDRTAENERKVRRKIGGICKHVDEKTEDGVPF